MRLKRIKLAGFKSFVDPATVALAGNLTAVVGPNGCGKSNIIDAVRWVMGESSAKTLRGDSMTDVIFSGSSARMPVGQAAIELIFDNSDGSLGGEYGRFSEISIRRQVTRELQSTYFLNGSKCRRRDIQAIFLGTGLGPRSYSIIEQGTISRFVEAKPDELRQFIEEAAGISKYKARRRETENRMRHTRENLARLQDIREELERQLQRLQRQAKAAQRYTELKQQERRVRAELLAIRWRALNESLGQRRQAVSEQALQLEAQQTQQRRLELQQEKRRSERAELDSRYQTVQDRIYQLGTAIARQEQRLQHQQTQARQQQQAQQRIEAEQQQATAVLLADDQKLAQLASELETLEPELALLEAQAQESAEQLETHEAAMQQWQQGWDEFNQQAMAPQQRAQVEQSAIGHLEQSLSRLAQRIERLEKEQADDELPDDAAQIGVLEEKLALLEEQTEQHQARLTAQLQQIEQQREDNARINAELDQARRQLQKLQGQAESLKVLQQAALGQTDQPVMQWLEKNRLHQAPRLAQLLQVDRGWELAVETVLGHELQAVCLPQNSDAATLVENFVQGRATLLERTDIVPDEPRQGLTPLLEKLRSPRSLAGLLAGIYVAQDLAQAQRLRSRLAPHESLVCRNGIWLGCGWIRLLRDGTAPDSVLAREQQLQRLAQQIEGLDEQIETTSVDLEGGLLQLKNAEQAREATQHTLNDLLRAQSELSSQLASRQAQREQVAQRRQRVTDELAELKDQQHQEQAQLAAAEQARQAAQSRVEEDAQRKEVLLDERDSLRARLDESRQRARHDKERAHQAALKQQSFSAQCEALEKNRQRLQAQCAALSEQLQQSRGRAEELRAPLPALQEALQSDLARQVELEGRLHKARDQVAEIDQDLSALEQQRQQFEQTLAQVRDALEADRVAAQGLQVQLDNLTGQLQELQYKPEQLLLGLPGDASETDWERKREDLQQKIQRLGAINLAAIDEYQTQSERKRYLDAQNNDLEEALATLEDAIRKIDRETRNKFRDTFERINAGLQELFPKVFGGGSAYLELTGEDLLDTGVAIMARPPGKRNSTIQLLSGGEKALTAIALVFAIFQLNPAPFCMLDEVDAPLDDANVGRFCRIVKEMSETVQFIYITHNKVSMEMASHMMGVTMHEPGVSRLVSVNVDEAAAMIAR